MVIPVINITSLLKAYQTVVFARKFLANNRFDAFPVAFCQPRPNERISDASPRKVRLYLLESASKCIVIGKNSLPSPIILRVGIGNGYVSTMSANRRRRDGPEFVPISSDCFAVRRICFGKYLLDAQSDTCPHGVRNTPSVPFRSSLHELFS